ncbi:hypothetical protein T4D_392 [Trichinella pseudospiralis]|uniref:Uncharacterized protein n=1 Tax=Trichinella pseudospiralis TaxID=6337 RepID=A0A0V1FQ55_TRIPS|nr:hypothetical protein T4D_392 [Trichinella pseudospiralis]
MIKHRYDDRYLHNGALEIGFSKLDLSEDLLLIGHFIFDLSEDLLLIGHFIFAFIFTRYVFIKISSFNWNHLICFPMCALLILLLDMQKQLQEQESY